MVKRILLFFTSVLISLLVTGCQVQPMHMYKHIPINADSDSEVRKQIEILCDYQYVRLRDEDEHTLLAFNQRKGASLKFRIQYSKDEFSIDYLDSSGYRYNGETIHPRYNWIVDYIAKGLNDRFGIK